MSGKNKPVVEEWEVDFYGGPLDGFYEIIPIVPPVLVRLVGTRNYVYSKAKEQKGGPIRYDYLSEQTSPEPDPV